MSKIFDIDLESLSLKKLHLLKISYPHFYGAHNIESPIAIYRASKNLSPCLFITASIHGDEVNGTHIAQTFISKIPKIKKGTVIIMPAVNIYGLINKERYLPDRKDLNRCFPGSIKGSFGSRFAHFIFENIKNVGDIYIDLHSGGVGRFNIPQIRCDLRNELTKEVIEHLSIPLVVNSSLRDGSLREALSAINKVCIVLEAGEGLRIDETMTKYGINLIKSVMAHLEMIQHRTKFNRQKVIIHHTRWIRAKEGGFFTKTAHKGMIYKKGQVLGEIKQLTGQIIETIKMKNDGVLLGVHQQSLIMPGDALFNVGFLDPNIHQEEEFFDYFDFEGMS